MNSPISAGAVVIVTLGSPREKFWGVLLELSGTGAIVRGIELESFDDFLRMLRHDEPATPTDVFFPMHRVERIELDASSNGLPSLSDRMRHAIGRTAREVLAG